MKNTHFTEDTTVLIPAAGEVPESLLPLSSKSSVAMVPMNGKPVIFWTLSYLRDLGYRKFIIAVHEHNSMLQKFITHIFSKQLDLSFIRPDRDGGVGYTVMQCSQKAKTKKVLLVLGDTFFEFPKLPANYYNTNYVLVSKVNEFYRWCIVETDESLRAKTFIEKSSTYLGNGSALIGVYYLADRLFFCECLQSVWDAKKNKLIKMELSEALTVYKEKYPIYAYTAKEWFDCGNPDNLIRSRRTFLQKREFNTISFDDCLGTITKKSKNIEKFIDEIDYYKLIPSELNILFPRIISSETRPDKYYITMEYYGYPTLSELFVFETLRPKVWHRIFEHLFEIIQRMLKYTVKADEYSFDYMYNSRVLRRVTQIGNIDGQIASLVNHRGELIINGKKYDNFSLIWPRVQKELKRMAEYRMFSIIHGDMCFSNILYDLTGGVCKFIDPRGSFGRKGCYGDVRYDIAKLYHSVHGLYDYIINDLFILECKNNKIEYEVFSNETLSEVQNSFDTIFFNSHLDKKEILLLEGMLFVTMGIFHKDTPIRQQAMYITGIKIWNEVLNENLY